MRKVISVVVLITMLIGSVPLFSGGAIEDGAIGEAGTRNGTVIWTDELDDAGKITMRRNVTLGNGSVTLKPNERSPTEHTLGLWHLNEGKGNTADDSSVNDNHAEIVGGTWTNGKFGDGLEFDGSDAGMRWESDPSLEVTDELTVEGWFKPYNGGWKFKRPIVLSDATPRPNYQVRISFDGSDLNYSKAEEGGKDVRFVDENGKPLEFWIENWNDGGASTVWVNVTDQGTSIIDMYYGNAEAEPAGLSWSGNITLMFESLPPEWSYSEVLDGRFPRGSLTYGGMGGNNEHNHSIYGITAVPSLTGDKNILGSDPVGVSVSWSKPTHNHTFQGMTENASSLPPYTNLSFGRKQEIPVNIPENSIAIFNTTSPAKDWGRFISLDGRFPRGETEFGGTGGHETHEHVFSLESNISTDFKSDFLEDTANSLTYPSRLHTHKIKGTTGSASSLPPYLDVIFAATEKKTTLPDGLIAIFDELPPLGWENFVPLNGKFPRGNNVYGNTGGSTVHSHPYVGVSDEPTTSPITKDVKGVGETITTPTVYHTHTFNGTSSEESILPPYLDVIFGRRMASDIEADIGLETPTAFSKPGSYGIGATPTQAFGSLKGHTVNANITPGWNYIVMTYDREEQRLYVNGELVAKKALSEPVSDTGSPLTAGYRYNGMIDEIAIYDIALSPKAISESALDHRPRGMVRSEDIRVPDGKIWSALKCSASVPENTSLNISLHDASSENILLSRSANGSEVIADLSSLNVLVHPEIYLRADLTPGKISTPSLLRWSVEGEEIAAPVFAVAINAVEVLEEEPETGILNLSDHFSDPYSHIIPPAYAVEFSSDPDNVSIETNGTYLDITYLAPDFSGTVTARVNCTNGYGLSTSTDLFRIRVKDVNDPPLATLRSPKDGVILNQMNITLGWDVRDVDDDPGNITYNVYVGTSRDPEIYREGVSERNLTFRGKNGKRYYWYVEPVDRNATGDCENGVWSFTIDIYTEAPVVELIAPVDSQVVNRTEVDLSWSVRFSEPTDVKFWIYLGKSEIDLGELESTTDTEFLLTDLEDDTTYYWTVVPTSGSLQGYCASGVRSFTVNTSFDAIYRLEAEADRTHLEILQGEGAAFNVTLTNEGNIPIEVTVTSTGNLSEYLSVVSPILLQPNSSETLRVTIANSTEMPTGQHELSIILEHEGGREEISIRVDVGPLTDIDSATPTPDLLWLYLAPGLLFGVILFFILLLVVGKRRKKVAPEVGCVEEETVETEIVAPEDSPFSEPSRSRGDVARTDKEEVKISSVTGGYGYLHGGKKRKHPTYTVPSPTDEKDLETPSSVRKEVKNEDLPEHERKRGGKTPSPVSEEIEDSKTGAEKMSVPPPPKPTPGEKGKATPPGHPDIDPKVSKDEALAPKPPTPDTPSPKSSGPKVVGAETEFTVTDIFLIYVDGRLIRSASFESGLQEGMDEDIMSGMLTAITDFIKDSFSEEKGALKTLQYGKLNIYIERGVSMYLAVVFRGEPTGDLRQKMRWLLIRIWDDHKGELKVWDGSTDGLEDIGDMLRLLMDQTNPKGEETGVSAADRKKDGAVLATAKESKTCGICMGVMKTGLEMVICNCGNGYHSTCGRRVGKCPVCGKSLYPESGWEMSDQKTHTGPTETNLNSSESIKEDDTVIDTEEFRIDI